MRRRGGIWTVGWVLFGLLAIATGMLVLGKRESVTRPSAFSYSPSGTHALVELLRAEGYKVEIDRSRKPRLSSNDLVVGFYVEKGLSTFDMPDVEGPAKTPENPTQTAIEGHLQKGGRALICQLPESFVEATQLAAHGARQVGFDIGSERAKYQLSLGSAGSNLLPDLPFKGGSQGFTLASDTQRYPVVRLFNEEGGKLCVLFDGIGCTNRFLDAEQNAAFFLKIVGILLPEHGRIVIAEALGGQAVEPGLLATIGSWASVAWWQLILVFIVLVFTLGRRFGLPEAERFRQRGGRELVDAYADVLARAKNPNIALKKIVDEVDKDVRKRFSISADLSPARRNEVLPPSLGMALSKAELASSSSLMDSSAVKLLKDLEREVAALKGEPAGRRRRRK